MSDYEADEQFWNRELLGDGEDENETRQLEQRSSAGPGAGAVQSTIMHFFSSPVTAGISHVFLLILLSPLHLL